MSKTKPKPKPIIVKGTAKTDLIIKAGTKQIVEKDGHLDVYTLTVGTLSTLTVRGTIIITKEIKICPGAKINCKGFEYKNNTLKAETFKSKLSEGSNLLDILGWSNDNHDNDNNDLTMGNINDDINPDSI